MLTGTIINALAILAGSAVGLASTPWRGASPPCWGPRASAWGSGCRPS